MPSGTFSATDISLPRGFTLTVNGTLVGVNGGNSMIFNQAYTTTGSIGAGSATLVTAPCTLRVGDILSIAGAGPLLDGVRLVHYAQVVDIAGLTVTLDKPAFVSVSGATVTWGATDIVVNGSGTIDGNQTYNGIGFSLARNCRVTGVLSVNNCAHGGVSISYGSRDCQISNISMDSNGEISGPTGSAVWLYSGVQNCVIENISVSGGSYAVIVDDRSVTLDTISGHKCLSNIIRFVTVNGNLSGIIVHGSDQNSISNCTISGLSGVGVDIDGCNQGALGERNSSDGNSVFNCAISGMGVGVWVARFGKTSKTTVSSISYSGNAINLINNEI